MPRDISRLNGLVKVRKLLEDQRRVELESLREKEYAAKEKLFHLKSEKRWSQDQLEKNEKTSLYLSYLDNLSQQSLYQSNLIKELGINIEKARQVLLDAAKSRKMVEKLLSREIKHYRQNMATQERKHLDEIATIRFARDSMQ